MQAAGGGGVGWGAGGGFGPLTSGCSFTGTKIFSCSETSWPFGSGNTRFCLLSPKWNKLPRTLSISEIYKNAYQRLELEIIGQFWVEFFKLFYRTIIFSLSLMNVHFKKRKAWYQLKAVEHDLILARYCRSRRISDHSFSSGKNLGRQKKTCLGPVSRAMWLWSHKNLETRSHNDISTRLYVLHTH